MADSPIFLDFETEPIENRPNYPPKPMGLGVRGLGRPRWLGWAYPTENNATREEARRVLRDAFRSGRPLVFHHAAFDLDVAEEHFGLRIPPHHLVHCTQIQGFLHDPNQKRLDLKTLGQLHLGDEPEERDELHEWIRANVPGAKRKKNHGEYYYLAPGKLVGKYCLMDLRFTKGLHSFFAPVRREMKEAYEREIKLIPILLDVERKGIPVSPKIRSALKQWETNLEDIDQVIRNRLGVRSLDCDSKDDVADAFEKAGLVDEWILTATGKRSVAWTALMEVCTDLRVTHLFRYRSKLTNSIRTFARPWVEMLDQTGGRAMCHWNSTPRPKDESGRSTLGARTGRLSSNPNMQNIPQTPMSLVSTVLEARKLQAAGEDFVFVPKSFLTPKRQLPWMRDYIAAPSGEYLANRDYSQQELRALAHYVRGSLLGRYKENPFLDFHAMMQGIINEALRAAWSRKHMKNTGFGVIYTMGRELFAQKLGIDDVKAAAALRARYKSEIQIDELEKDLKTMGRMDEPMWTWGGRRYFVEPTTFVNNVPRSFEYKLLNTLIQGSCADATKEFMVRYYDEPKREGYVSALVHDESLAFFPLSAAKEQMRLMAACMESLEFDVPMVTDGRGGRTSWARAKDTSKGEREWRNDSGRVVHETRRRQRRVMVRIDYKHGRSAGSRTTSTARRKRSTDTSKSAQYRAVNRWREVAGSTKRPRFTSRPAGSRSSAKI